MNAEEYAFLCDVREFDLRQGWKEWHFNNCAEWLNYKCGIVPGTAREKVRVAQALTFLPMVHVDETALRDQLVRAICRSSRCGGWFAMAAWFRCSRMRAASRSMLAASIGWCRRR
jgi:hypothetical protein